MAADLNINYEATRATGNNVKAKAEEFGSLLGSINSLNESLKSSWQGGDAESYTSKITEQAEVMKKIQNSMSEIGDYLVQAGNLYEETMNSNKIN